MGKFSHIALATLLLAGALPAQAQSESTPLPPPELDEPNHRLCSREALFNCLDGVGSGATSLDTLRSHANGISRPRGAGSDEERAAAVARLGLPGRERGMAAGESMLGGWTVWGSYSRSDSEGTTTLAPYDANTDGFLVGVDRLIGERFVLGATVGYERTDSNTLFNGGSQDRDGYSVAVYGAWLINDVLSLDASAGYARITTDEDRLDPNNGRTLTADYDAERGFVTANLNAVKAFGPVVVGGRVGWLYTAESQDAFTERGCAPRQAGVCAARTVGERHVDLGQVYAGVDVGYGIGDFEPYAIAIYRNDLGRDDGASAGGLPGGVRPQPDDDDELQLGLGVRYFGGNGITGSLEWLRTNGRASYDDDAFSLTVRVPF
ncbi:MAG: autotransporter outer membrane beta-barrel domain-containing protein [Ectothiorhodospiraceae bacterium]|nr:autotransporter outer membrane beta-barrel domain-containing protein [Chromatiales bacterium]MCP5157610.1 autotransporter outer membrane beta-barrel domain-containing protein [Ectothiorhodospiraceae bacterium]